MVEQQFRGSQGSLYQLEGWADTSLAWNKDRSRWEFLNRTDKTVIAFCNDTSEYPLGHQR